MIRTAVGEIEAGAELLTAALELRPGFDLVHAEIARSTLAGDGPATGWDGSVQSEPKASSPASAAVVGAPNASP